MNKKCKFCSQSDESRLALSSKLVNGKVIHEWVCLDCLFVDIFVTLGEYGKRTTGRENRRELLSGTQIRRDREKHSRQFRPLLFSERYPKEAIRQ